VSPIRRAPKRRDANPSESELRAALAARMHGRSEPTGLPDDVAAAYDSALRAGMPLVPTADLFAHEVPPAVTKALRDWQESTRGGPCRACGSRTPRPPRPRPGALREPTWSTLDGLRVCGWCASWDSADHPADAVGRKVAGILGTDDYTDCRVKLAHELPYVGRPFGWLTGQAVDDFRSLIATRIGGQPTRYRTRPDTDPLPFVESFVWAADAVPRKPRAELRGADRLARIRTEWEADVARAKGREERRRRIHLEALAKADATMDPARRAHLARQQRVLSDTPQREAAAARQRQSDEAQARVEAAFDAQLKAARRKASEARLAKRSAVRRRMIDAAIGKAN
jgi:hypothetical protein